MTRDQAVALIQEELGFRSDLAANIVGRMKQAQRLLEHGRSLPVFLLEQDASIVAAAGSAEVALPTGFIRWKQDEGLRYTTTTGSFVKLEKVPLDIGAARFLDADDGKPLAYTLRKDTIKVYPDRDQAYTLTASYYKEAVALDSNIENEWLAHAPDVLVGRAGMFMCGPLRNDAAMARFLEIYGTAWASMFADGIMREEEDEPLHVGGRL